MKKTLRVLALIALIASLIGLSGCEGLFATYTMKVRSYYSSSVYDVKYRESGTTDWKTADLEDEDGGVVIAVDDGTLWDTEAFFDLPGSGTYDFSVYNVLGTKIAEVSDVTIDIDLGSISNYDYVLSLDSAGVLEVY